MPPGQRRAAVVERPSSAGTPRLSAEARAAVLTWFDARGRKLAFRGTRDPWAVLVSEVMAQQTQVSRVEPAWAAFLERFPTPASLAAASPADVLRRWQGMGYNRRALRLRAAAIAIRDRHAGQVPEEIPALEDLPGIGPYTARAVAAIAFAARVGAVDTNVRRVLTRSLAGGRAPAAGVPDWSPATVQAAADASVDTARPGDWTHALMDIGATLCRPRSVSCEECPLRPWCASAGTLPLAAGSRRGLPAIPAAGGAKPRFTSTTRWLRGRIVDRLRGAEGPSWTTLDAPIGGHDEAAVVRALQALAREGVVELDGTDRLRARLPVA